MTGVEPPQDAAIAEQPESTPKVTTTTTTSTTRMTLRKRKRKTSETTDDNHNTDKSHNDKPHPDKPHPDKPHPDKPHQDGPTLPKTHRTHAIPLQRSKLRRLQPLRHKTTPETGTEGREDAEGGACHEADCEDCGEVCHTGAFGVGVDLGVSFEVGEVSEVTAGYGGLGGACGIKGERGGEGGSGAGGDGAGGGGKGKGMGMGMGDGDEGKGMGDGEEMITKTLTTTKVSRNTKVKASKITTKSAGKTTDKKAPAKKNTTEGATGDKAEWPPRFREVERLHRALNVVYTFLSTRKHVATTFEALRPAVEEHLGGKGVKVEDVAEVAFLRDGGARFEFVDEGGLMASIKGGESLKEFEVVDGRGRGAVGLGGADGCVGPSGGGAAAAGRGEGEGPGMLAGCDSIGPEVLLFEFMDMELKREVINPKTGAVERPKKQLKSEDLKMPVYGQKQLSKVIEKRNARFMVQLGEFLARCKEEGVDPEATLLEKRERFIPRPTPASEVGVRRRVGSKTKNQQQLSQTIPPTIPKQRKSIPEIVAELKAAPWYVGQIVPDGHRIFEPQEAVYGDLEFLMSQSLVNALYNSKGITQFYSHQAAALNHLHAGRHVVVSTSTSSGKSLIYQVPVLHALEQDRQTRALFVFPTKALAQDQRRSLQEMMGYMDCLGEDEKTVEIYDGDTPRERRKGIREIARVIFTNPDMLHCSVLPSEAKWRGFLQNLRFVVVDELHYYNSLTGIHMSYILRRLRRVCAAIGNTNIFFISCSATVSNPLTHFSLLSGLPPSSIRLIDQDGSPSDHKEFLCWNPPFRRSSNPRDLHTTGRTDSMQETARLIVELVLRGVRVISFCRVRAQVERLVACIRQLLGDVGRGEVGSMIMAYRGGYTPQDRREIERQMFAGNLLGIVATTALELGVDIGSLDAVVTWGFPYSVSNLRQQGGRAGRRGIDGDSLNVLVGTGFATDQYYMKNPGELFERPHEALSVDLGNLGIAEGHLQCAAKEMPMRVEVDGEFFGPANGVDLDLEEVCRTHMVGDAEGFWHPGGRWRPEPWRLVNIRGTDDEDAFAVVDITGGRTPVVLEELEAGRVSSMLYEGGIWLHQGGKYAVRGVDVERRIARVERVQVDWETVPRHWAELVPVEVVVSRRLDVVPEFSTDENEAQQQQKRKKHQEHGQHSSLQEEEASISTATEPTIATTTILTATAAPANKTRAYAGTVRIHHQVFGYFKVSTATNQIIDAIDTNTTPPVTRFTNGTWLDLPPRALGLLANLNLDVAASIHGACHAVISLMGIYVVGADRGVIVSECHAPRRREESRDDGGSGTGTAAGSGGKGKKAARLLFYDKAGSSSSNSHSSANHSSANHSSYRTGGGSEFCRRAFDFMDVLLRKAVERMEDCPCREGCLECGVLAEFCGQGQKGNEGNGQEGEGQEVVNKRGAVVVLRCLLGWGIDVRPGGYGGKGVVGGAGGVGGG